MTKKDIFRSMRTVATQWEGRKKQAQQFRTTWNPANLRFR